MLIKNISEETKISAFNRVCTPTLQDRITDIQTRNPVAWTAFKDAVIDAFSLDDLTKVTRRGFEDWVASPSKQLSVTQTMAVFEEKFGQLSVRDRALLISDKVMLFLQAVDVRDRKELGILLEDVNGMNGLIED